MNNALNSNTIEDATIVNETKGTAYFKEVTVAYRLFKNMYVWLCVFLVTYMLYLSMSYKAILVLSKGLLLFKAVLAVAVLLAIVVGIWHKRRGHSARETIKFVWEDK